MGRGGGLGDKSIQAPDLFGQVIAEVGGGTASLEKPPPLFPEIFVKSFKWEAGDEEEFLMKRAVQMGQWVRASAYNLDATEASVATHLSAMEEAGSVPGASSLVVGGPAASAQLERKAQKRTKEAVAATEKLLLAHIADSRYSDIYPKDLVPPAGLLAGRKRKIAQESAAARRKAMRRLMDQAAGGGGGAGGDDDEDADLGDEDGEGEGEEEGDGEGSDDDEEGDYGEFMDNDDDDDGVDRGDRDEGGGGGGDD